MKVDYIKDYAMPCMMAERSVKNVYELMLKNDPDTALKECNKAINEIHNLIEAINWMKNK